MSAGEGHKKPMIKFLIQPIYRYMQFARSQLFHRREVEASLDKPLRTLITNFERSGIVLNTISFIALFLVETIYTRSASLFHIIPFILIVAGALGSFYSAGKDSRSPWMISAYYVFLFLVTFYYPAAMGSYGFERDANANFLVHLAVLITQVLRPGRWPGLFVALFLLVHYVTTLLFQRHVMDPAEWLHILFFLWTAGMVVFIEKILFNNTLRFLVLKEREEKEEAELELAEKVHHNLFPLFRENQHLRMHHFRSPENITGGDFFDLIHLREGNIGFFLTDISGHGVSSAMMSAALKVIISNMPYAFRLNPEHFLTRLDHVMHKSYGSHHASAVYIFMDFHKRKVRIGNAGHPYILYSTGGSPFQELETKGSLLGFELQTPIVKEKRITIRKGDRFLIYTDGLTEYQGNDGQVHGDVDIKELTAGLESEKGDVIIGTILEKMRKSEYFEAFRDDVMIVLLEIK